MSRINQLIATVLSIAVFAPLGFVFAADRGHSADATPQHAARIYGCHYEDSCTIDYRPSGVWVIRHR